MGEGTRQDVNASEFRGKKETIRMKKSTDKVENVVSWLTDMAEGARVGW